MTEFKKVEVPVGTFIGWGMKATSPPQQVTIDVLDYDEFGGKDFNGNVCPQLAGTLVEDCVNYRDKGSTKETLKAGAMVQVTCGLANLKRAIKACEPQRADLVRMTHSEDIKVSDGTVKVIEVEHAPGAGKGLKADEGDTVSEDEL
jgi:hypothetical protein